MTKVATHQLRITKNTVVEFRGEGKNYHDAQMEAARQATELVELVTEKRDQILQAAKEALASGYDDEPEGDS